MKRPIAMIAGFLIVPACGVVAILTAQERYNNRNSAKDRRVTGLAQVPMQPTILPTLGGPQRSFEANNQPTHMNVYYPAVSAYSPPAQFNSPMHESALLVQQAQQALANARSDEEREGAQANLRKALNLQFDADMEQREKELEGIRRRLTEMTRLLEKRSAAKEQIVELRLQVLAQDAAGLGWASAVGRWPSNLGPGPGVQLPNLPPPNYNFSPSPYSDPGTGFNAPAAPSPPNMSIPNIVNGSNLESLLPSIPAPAIPGPGTALPPPAPARAPRPNNPVSEPSAFQKNNDARSEQPLFSADKEPARSEKNRSPDNDDSE